MGKISAVFREAFGVRHVFVSLLDRRPRGMKSGARAPRTPKALPCEFFSRFVLIRVIRGQEIFATRNGFGQ